MIEDKPKIDFVDKRRIKDVDDTCDDADEADLDRVPTFIEEMQGKVEASDERLKEYISAHKEKMGEMDQVRKRLEEDVERRAEIRFGELMADLFPILDDLDRAIKAAKDTDPNNQSLEGVVILRNQFFEVLSNRGLEMIDCVGEPFDPEMATAVAIEPVNDDKKDNIVVEMLAPGFRVGERVLRHAMVKVGQKT
ncbi:MAG TPA: nucleotide exchange factor GrpE [Nitrospinota bacterium]|nr:nucleotide exchange factor GrpE [Nitrospinota bacterium]|tara:strand:- start:36622 stop:37203 length:582 start_codon:yes stop_codon:yes gene_type:complete